MVRSIFVSGRGKNIIGAPAPHPPTQIYLFAVDSVKIHNDFWDYLSSEMSCRVWQNEACRLEYECLENLIFGSWYIEYWIWSTDKPEICKCQSLLDKRRIYEMLVLKSKKKYFVAAKLLASKRFYTQCIGLFAWPAKSYKSCNMLYGGENLIYCVSWVIENNLSPNVGKK